MISDEYVERDKNNPDNIVRGISSINSISLITLEGSGMIGIPGFSKRLFESLSNERINVILITQSSSEHSITVAIDTLQSEKARLSVNRTFSNEIELKKLDPLRVEEGFLLWHWLVRT